MLGYAIAWICELRHNFNGSVRKSELQVFQAKICLKECAFRYEKMILMPTFLKASQKMFIQLINAREKTAGISEREREIFITLFIL
jgi:hypothetical protein